MKLLRKLLEIPLGLLAGFAVCLLILAGVVCIGVGTVVAAACGIDPEEGRR